MMVKDAVTGAMRPYDPDLDYELPLAGMGTIPPDPSDRSAKPLNPHKDIK
jgi:hypothetical protein